MLHTLSSVRRHCHLLAAKLNAELLEIAVLAGRARAPLLHV